MKESFGFKGSLEEKKKLLPFIFAFSYIWGMGASLDSSEKEKVKISSLSYLSFPCRP
jgi:hypothetical protein